MRLRVLTGLLIAIVITLLVAAPLALGPVPKKTATRKVRREYSVRALEYVSLLILTFSGSAVGSIFIIRKERAEYRQESLKNIQELVQSSLKDTKRPEKE